MKTAILTISDRSARGEQEDKSGSVIKEVVTEAGGEVLFYEIIPDEKDLIEAKLKEFADRHQVELILTTGGTGFSPRDVTPEATLAVIDRQAPGFAEVMRQKSLEATPHAMLSRAVSGIRKKTVIINLPGSPKAAKECLQTILPALPHGVDILQGKGEEQARKSPQHHP